MRPEREPAVRRAPTTSPATVEEPQPTTTNGALGSQGRGGHTTVEVRELVDALRRHLVLVGAVAIACALVAVVLTAVLPARYTATARGFVSVGSPQTRSPNVMTSGSLYILARMPSYAALGTSSGVLDGVRSSLGLDESTEDLRRRVTSSAVVDTAFIEVTVADRDPAVAERVADAVVNELGQAVGSLENGTVTMQLSNPATLPIEPSNRDYLVNGGVALGAGLVLGVGSAVVLDVVRRRRRA